MLVSDATAPAAAPAQASPRAQQATQAPASVPLHLTLPAPTGPHPVGTTSLHLVDRSRPDPVAGPGRYRELMISLWYPARHTHRYPRAPWLPAGAGAAVLAAEGIDPGAVDLPLTHGHEGAPVRRRGRLPVVLYSTGNDAFRSANTIVVEELASRGYLVVTIDHTYDGVVQFPDGRVITPVPDGPASAELHALRVGDTRFVLDALTAIDNGHNPDVDRHRLPAGLTGGVDLRKVGMFGISAGGATTASAMYADRRIAAGLSLDGPVHGPVVAAGLDRPFMLIQAKINRQDFPDLAEFWSHLRGWRLNLGVQGAAHLSYSDYESLVPQLATVLPIDVREQIGALDPARGIAVQRAYPVAFFDRHLRQRGHLLDGPSPRFPEVHIID
ncbi:MAG TPA: acetylhydrolase [Catenuloplanes sp.]|jgi:predicted dienelactone hydrolase